MEQYIGIDPDLDKSGVAIIFQQRIQVLNCTFNHLVFTFFKNLADQQISSPNINTTIFIEAPYLNKTFFQPVKAAMPVIAKMNRNIGENHAVAKIIVECAKSYGLNVIPVLPVRSTNYRDRGKKITGPQYVQMLERHGLLSEITASNQETRDAALIAVTYGLDKEPTSKEKIFDHDDMSKHFFNKVTKVGADMILGKTP